METGDERELGKSVLVERHDDDDDDNYYNYYYYFSKYVCMYFVVYKDIADSRSTGQEYTKAK